MVLLNALLLLVAIANLVLRLRPGAGSVPTHRNLFARLTAGRIDLSLSLTVARADDATPSDRSAQERSGRERCRVGH
jgi:hypothetical protein